MAEYRVERDFQVKTARVLVLDRDYEFNRNNVMAYIDGKAYEYRLNSIRNWVIILGDQSIDQSFAGKTVIFK